MQRIGNTILVMPNGNLPVPFQVPPLEFVVQGNQFPTYRLSGNGYGSFNFYGVGANTIYFDFGDGSEVLAIDFTNSWLWDYSTSYPVLHTYATSATRTVKIWFKYSWRITQIRINWMYFYSAFPRNIGLFKLSNFEVSVCNFASFPTTFKGGIFDTFIFSQGLATNYSISAVPDGILSSRIRSLQLAYSFNLSNSASNKLEQLINISGLQILALNHSQLTNSSIPTTWKNITTLRQLGLGSNSFTSIPQNITDCSQLTYLEFGRAVSPISANLGSMRFTSWGSGVGGMNIATLYCEGRTSGSEWTTDAITGLENCPALKQIYLRCVFTTQAGIDTFVDNMYALVVANASPANSSTGALRGISLRISAELSTSYLDSYQPSGTYQAPTGFVLYSNNGTPTTPKEKLYVLSKNYRWTIYVRGATRSAIITYAP